MTLSEWSYTAMVYAAVGYLLAFALHALEWAVGPRARTRQASRWF